MLPSIQFKLELVGVALLDGFLQGCGTRGAEATIQPVWSSLGAAFAGDRHFGFWASGFVPHNGNGVVAFGCAVVLAIG